MYTQATRMIEIKKTLLRQVNNTQISNDMGSCKVEFHLDRPIICKMVKILTYETTSLSSMCSVFIGRLIIHRLVGRFKI
jgi:hypothetical protein